jgi:hypothetical protein
MQCQERSGGSSLRSQVPPGDIAPLEEEDSNKHTIFVPKLRGEGVEFLYFTYK